MKKYLNNIEVYLGSICSIAMVVILFMQVVSRYVFNNAFSWAEELAIILFVLSTYFGATAAITTKQHLRLEVITEKLSPKNKLRLEIVNNAFFALFNVIVLTGVVPMVQRLRENGTETAVTHIPKWSVYIFLPVLFVLMIVRLIQSSMDNLKKIKALDEEKTV